MNSPHEPTYNAHDFQHRKKIGAFYTPLTVSSVLSEWGIRSTEDRILEPCFGGCTFLEAAIARFSALGATTPELNIYGCDIDPLAFSYLKDRINPNKTEGHFFLQDFLDLSPNDLLRGKVDLVIGNPPYIKHSNFSEENKDFLKSNKLNGKVKIHGRANLWAYFLLHALGFLKKNGRLALVLPGSFLYAHYSKKIRDHLCQSFEKVSALALAERIFTSEGTEETTVVLLAEGYKNSYPPSTLQIKYVENANELSELAKKTEFKDAHPGHGLIPIEVGELFNKFSAVKNMRKFSEIAAIRIGLVTGNTPYFIKSKKEWSRIGIEKKYLRYILPRSQYISGVVVNTTDCEKHIDNNIRCLALDTPKEPKQAKLLEYLNSYPVEERDKNSTFKRRSIWHRFLNDNTAPDAFFVFMAEQGLRLVLNSARVDATNSVYRVYFNKEITPTEMKLATISMCTTFSQLAAEIIGHPRGSGALKIEPSGVKDLMLYMPCNRTLNEIDFAFSEVNLKLKSLDIEGARHTADEFLFDEKGLRSSLQDLRTGLAVVRSRRIR